jgi:hypothetical protein
MAFLGNNYHYELEWLFSQQQSFVKAFELYDIEKISEIERIAFKNV